jgi:trigger factor
MKKIIISLLLSSLTILSAVGCGNSSVSKDGVVTTGNSAIDNAVYTNDSVSLAPYTGLTAEKKVYTVTDDALQSAIDEAVSSFIEYNSVDRASKEGDWIYADFTASIDGSVVDEEEDYYLIVGTDEYGEDFDKAITGVSSGDKLNFSVTYDDDYEDEDWAGQTVDFSLTVNDVEEEVAPDLTDDFVREKLEYDSYDDFVAATKASLEETYESESDTELRDDLIQQVIDASSILQYTEDEYNDAYSEIEEFYQSYADMFGMELDDIYESFGIDEDSVKEDALDQLYRNLVIAAIAENEGLSTDSISDEDFDAAVSEYTTEYEYDSTEDFLADYGEDVVKNQLLEDAVLDILVENANITEVETEYEE